MPPSEAVEIVEPDTETKTVAAGDVIDMKCVGGPGVDLLWYHNGMPLTTSSKVLITDARDMNTRKITSLLSIRSVTEANAGKYE